MNSYWETRANNINQAAENRKTEEVFRQAKRSDKPPRTDKLTCPVFKLEEHFTNHFKEQPAPAAEDLKDPAKIDILPKLEHITINDNCPTLAAVEAAVKYLKNRRGVGVDGVASEYLKYSGSAELIVLMTSFVHWNSISYLAVGFVVPQAGKTRNKKKSPRAGIEPTTSGYRPDALPIELTSLLPDSARLLERDGESVRFLWACS